MEYTLLGSGALVRLWNIVCLGQWALASLPSMQHSPNSPSVTLLLNKMACYITLYIHAYAVQNLVIKLDFIGDHFMF